MEILKYETNVQANELVELVCNVPETFKVVLWHIGRLTSKLEKVTFDGVPFEKVDLNMCTNKPQEAIYFDDNVTFTFSGEKLALGEHVSVTLYGRYKKDLTK